MSWELSPWWDILVDNQVQWIYHKCFLCSFICRHEQRWLQSIQYCSLGELIAMRGLVVMAMAENKFIVNVVENDNLSTVSIVKLETWFLLFVDIC